MNVDADQYFAGFAFVWVAHELRLEWPDNNEHKDRYRDCSADINQSIAYGPKYQSAGPPYVPVAWWRFLTLQARGEPLTSRWCGVASRLSCTDGSVHTRRFPKAEDNSMSLLHCSYTL